MQLTIAQKDVKLSNIDKTFWPEQGYTKGDMINYYIKIYPYLEQYLYNRPLTLHIYPDGITGKSFYQKNCPDYAPDWLTTTEYKSGINNVINYVMINKLPDLVWAANRASIELHSWFSTINSPHKPNFAVFDLDPGKKTDMKTTVKIANLIKSILDELNLKSYIKTSGKRGLHIFIPLNPVYNYKEVKHFLKKVAEIVISIKPDKTTLQWRKEKRQGKLHIDYRQNARGKTIPAPYSLRPTKNAKISTPLRWAEITDNLDPANYNFATITGRINNIGNLWSDILNIKQNLPGDFIKG